MRVSEIDPNPKMRSLTSCYSSSLAVANDDDAAKIIAYYKRRWFIEDYNRLLKKKGFGIENIQVESRHAFEINLAVSIKSA